MPADSLPIDTDGQFCCVVADGGAWSVFVKNEITGMNPVGPRLIQCANGHAPTPPFDVIQVSKEKALLGLKKWDFFLEKQRAMQSKKK